MASAASLGELPEDSPLQEASWQPSHTLYGGAHLFRADSAVKMSRLAQQWEDRFGEGELTAQQLPLDDLRIDFEDGYGPRDDAEEDLHGQQVGEQLRRALLEGSLPRRWGIRIKPLTRRWAARAVRTLEAVVSQLDDAFSLRVTVPKVEHASQVEFILERLSQLQQRYGARLELELMVESPRGLELVRSWTALPEIRSVHFGPYDFLASCGVRQGSLHHPLCVAGRTQLLFAAAGSHLEWADGPTTRLPLPPHREADREEENRRAVRAAWAAHQDDLIRSREAGYFQSWLLHPAQLVSLHRLLRREVAQSWPEAARRYANFLDSQAQATRVGEQFDDRATARLLYLQLDEARRMGVVTPSELEAAVRRPWRDAAL